MRNGRAKNNVEIAVDDVHSCRITDMNNFDWYKSFFFQNFITNHRHFAALYRMNGTRAVELHGEPGFERYINTDDPEGLERAIRQALEARGQKLEQPRLENTV